MNCESPITVRHPASRSISFRRALSDINLHTLGSPEALLRMIQVAGTKIVVPCGRCPACRRRYSSEWRTRLVAEHVHGRHSNVMSVLMTIDPAHYVGKDGLGTDIAGMIRKFIFQYRYNFRDCDEYGMPINKTKAYAPVPKYWFTVERGEKNGRLHIHGFIWDSRMYVAPNKRQLDIYHLTRRLYGSKNAKCKFNIPATENLQKCWPFGRVWVNIDSEDPRNCSYVSKYFTKPQQYALIFRRVYCSHGIGKCLSDKVDTRRLVADYLSHTTTVVESGQRMVALPRYNRRALLLDALGADTIRKNTEDYLLSINGPNPPPFREWYNNVLYYDPVVLDAARTRDRQISQSLGLVTTRSDSRKPRNSRGFIRESYDMYMSYYLNNF